MCLTPGTFTTFAKSDHKFTILLATCIKKWCKFTIELSKKSKRLERERHIFYASRASARRPTEGIQERRPWSARVEGRIYTERVGERWASDLIIQASNIKSEASNF